MKYIESLREGERINEIYLCKVKQSALTKAGKPYDNLILQDKTGTLDAKIWEPGSVGIDEFDSLDYIAVMGDITSFQGNLQLNVKRVRKVQEGEYDPKDYLPVSKKDIDGMYTELLGLIASVKHPYLRKLLESFFVEDKDFEKRFKFHSAAKSVHHGFVGGLLEHTLNVTKLCDFYTKAYHALNRDLLLTAAIFHDIGKTKIPEEILNAPRKLTPEEFEVMKRHPLYSFELLGDDISEDVRYAVRWHHEKLDGKGYPDGLKAESISYFARITTISDIYDAMLSARSYKKEKIPFDVLQWFVTEGSKGIDQNLLNIFIKNMVKVYRQQQVIMSDGREGCVEYIPLNDMDHPVVSVGEEVRQVDEDWYCVHMV